MLKPACLCLIGAAGLTLLSGCAASRVNREGSLIGAAAGALFSGAGSCGKQSAGDCPIGVSGGTLLDGTIGYLEAYSELMEGPPAPPAPPLIAQQSAEAGPAAGSQQAAELPHVANQAQPAATASPTPASTATPPGPQPTSVPPTPVPPEIIVPGQQAPASGPVVLQGVFFGRKSSSLGRRQMRILDDAVATLKAHPELRIYVKGYSDSRGSAELNQRLSQERAATVAAYLISKGVALSQIRVMGMGSSHPLASNDTAAGRALNRRVELEPIREQ